jgi:hypothetical protein
LTRGIPDIERLDALMRSVFGLSLQQFYNQALLAGYKDGYKQGIKGGRRLAKGKPEFPITGPPFLKSRGAPKVLGHETLREQFIEFVDDVMREEGVSLPAAVSKYRDLMRRSELKGILEVPDQERLLRLYKRNKLATKLKR